MKNLIHGLAHIGVPCSNLENSIVFYSQFGFEVTVRQSHLNGYHVAMITNDSCTIELYEATNQESPDLSLHTDGHIDHIALATDDLPALYHYCQVQQLPIVSNGIESTTLWEPQQCSYFIITGPDQERIEFAQIEQL